MKKYFKKQEGMALPFVLIVMVCLAILGTAILSRSLAETNFAVRDEKQLGAHYIAQAGVDTVAKYFISSPNLAKTLINDPNGLTDMVGEGNYKAVVTGNISTGIKIQSTGTIIIGSKKFSETVYLSLKPNSTAAQLFKNVVYSNGSLDLDKVDVTGPLESALTIDPPPGYTYPVTQNSPQNYEAFAYPSPALTNKGALNMPNNSTATIDAEGEYSTIDVTNGSVLTFEVPAGDADGILNVVVTNLVCKGSIKITGGKVFLFVRNKVDIQTAGNINIFPGDTPASNPNNLTVFLGDIDSNGNYTNNGTFSIQAGPGFGGFLYGPKSTVSTDSSNTLIYGAVICNNFSAANNSDVVFVAAQSDVDYASVVSNWSKTVYSSN